MHRERFLLTLPSRKRRVGTRGHQYEEAPPSQEEVIVEIDIERIANVMGLRAIDSASGKCRDGFVVVKHIRKAKGS